MAKTIGTLLPLSSLYSKTHSYNYVKSSKVFIDWLVNSNQTAWQMLPLHQTYWKASDLTDSPYSSYGIGLNPALKEYLVKTEAPHKFFERFYETNSFWLEDYSLFLVFSHRFGTDYWPKWPQEYQNYHDLDIKKEITLHQQMFDRHVKTQVDLHYNFLQIKQYANTKGVTLMGDLPFFLDIRSPLVWKFRDRFEIGKNGLLEYHTGVVAAKQFPRQSWGHPLFRWDTKDQQKKILELFNMRLHYIRQIYDRVRLDAVARIYVYDKIHATDPTQDIAGNKGPGDPFFSQLLKLAHTWKTNPFVEDMSSIDMTHMHKVMEKTETPGISIFTLAIPKNQQKIDVDFFHFELKDTDHIFYTSNHDSPTLLGYLESISETKARYLARELGTEYHPDPKQFAILIRNHLLKQVQHIIIPLQDWIGSTKRINKPGTENPENWSYVMEVPVEQLSQRSI